MSFPNDEAADAVIAAALDRVRQAKIQFGMSRLQLGALLCHVHDNELWQGRARGFVEYLEGEHLNISAAYQFMRVARKFILELRLSPSCINAIAAASMKVLDAAGRIATPDNVDEIIAIVTVLHDRDALAFLAEVRSQAKDAEDTAAPKGSAAVSSLLSRFRLLPDDARIEFLQRLNYHRHGRPEPTPRI